MKKWLRKLKARHEEGMEHMYAGMAQTNEIQLNTYNKIQAWWKRICRRKEEK